MKPLRVITLLVVAAAGLALAVFSGRATDQPQFRIVELDSPEITGEGPGDPEADRGPATSARSRSLASDQVDYLAQLDTALGRTLWIAPGASTGSESGTREDPWHDLARALGDLRSGDRLVLLPGRYTGPFVLPDFEGDDPIEIVGRGSPVLRNEAQADAPVVRIEGRWRLIGLEIQPGPSSLGVEIPSGAEAQLRFLHINSGGREGVVIGAAARHVTVLESHIHHVGGADGAGIRIEDGARDLQLIRNKIHATGGEPILLFESGRFEELARGREGSRQAQLPDLGITIIEDIWEP